VTHPPLDALLGGTAEAHLAGCAACQRLVALVGGRASGSDAGAGEPGETGGEGAGASPSAGWRGGEGGAGAAGARYDRLEPLHRGGMGRTIRAWDRLLEREVLLKELAAPPGLVADGLEARFEREARLTAALSHPSIVPIHDLGRGEDGRPFYAMPLVEGHTLTEVIAATAAAARPGLVRLVASVADALAYAHTAGVVHRDVKPDNVLVGSFGQVVVIDWGLAARVGGGGAGDSGTAAVSLREREGHEGAAVGSGGDVTEGQDGAAVGPGRRGSDGAATAMETLGEREGHEGAAVGPGRGVTGGQDGAAVGPDAATATHPRARSLTALGVGTPAYMPPEQAAGGRADPRQDVYALGATLYHCLTGAPPWGSRTGPSIRAELAARAPVAPLAARAPGTPPALVSLVERAMAADPADRFPDAVGLAAELRAWLDGQVVASHRYSAWERAGRWVRAHRTALGVAAAGLAGAAVVAAASVVSLSRAHDAALVELERSAAVQAEQYASQPARTADALQAALRAMAVADGAGRPPSDAARAALRLALAAGPAARRLDGLAGWGPRAGRAGALVLADPARKVWWLGDGRVVELPSGLGHPATAALSPDGRRWAVSDVDGQVVVSGGARFAAPVAAVALAWLGADALLFVGADAVALTDLAGVPRWRAAGGATVGSAGGVAWVGDAGGGVRRVTAAGAEAARAVADTAITAVAARSDGVAWVGTTTGEVRSADGGPALVSLPGPVEAMDAAGDCLSVTLHDGAVFVLPVGPACGRLVFAGARGGGLRPDGGAVVVVEPGRACVADTYSGAHLRCLDVPNALGGGFLDDRAAYVIGGDGLVVWDTAVDLSAHRGEVVAVVAAGEAALTASSDGVVAVGTPGVAASSVRATLPGGISAAVAWGEQLAAGGYDGALVVVGAVGPAAQTALADAVGGLLADGDGLWAATMDGAVVRLGPTLAPGTGWTVPGGVRGLRRLPGGLLTLGLDGVARAWSRDGAPGPTWGGGEHTVGEAAVAADGTVWLRDRAATVRWDPVRGEVLATLPGRLVGVVGGPITAEPSGVVRSFDAGGALRAQWSERTPPRGVTSTGLVIGGEGSLRRPDGAWVGRTPAPLVDAVRVGAWEVAGDVAGGVVATPVDDAAAVALACDRLAVVLAGGCGG
jgi:serine/threonine protein kinase